MSKFKYSVIGRNTKENRELLEKVGYTRMASINGNIILCFSDGGYSCVEFEGNLDKAFNDAVKCTHSDELFCAVSAIREHSDAYQWFILTMDVPSFLTGSILKKGTFFKKGKHFKNSGAIFRKATLEDLQKHFN